MTIGTAPAGSPWSESQQTGHVAGDVVPGEWRKRSEIHPAPGAQRLPQLPLPAERDWRSLGKMLFHWA
jgi:hypothetical protein